MNSTDSHCYWHAAHCYTAEHWRWDEQTARIHPETASRGLPTRPQCYIWWGKCWWWYGTWLNPSFNVLHVWTWLSSGTQTEHSVRKPGLFVLSCGNVGWKHCNLVYYLSHMWSASGETFYNAHVVVEVVICQCLTLEAWFQSHTSPCWTFVGYNGTGTSSSPITGISTYQNHFTNDPYLFIHLLPILYTLSRWQCCEITYSVMDLSQ